MRIIKLSKVEFKTLGDAQRFFHCGLKGLDKTDPRPPGKFRVPSGWIARKNGLRSAEPLVFTYNARIVFTACADSGMMDNLHDTGNMKKNYPYCFIVDLDTLQECEVGLGEFETRYHTASGRRDKLVGSQGWNKLDDSVHTDAIWKWLRKN